MVLAAVLWIVVILTILALGLGRQTQLELALTDLSVKKLQSKHAAMAGVFYSMQKIKEDALDKETSQQDTSFACGVRLEEGQAPENIFADVALEDQRFTVRFPDPSKGEWRYGLQDEESKLNLNALTPQNYEILKWLITELGYGEEVAETVASSVLDWKDTDSEVFNPPYGSEETSVFSSADDVKNTAFDSVAELRMVKGVTEKMYQDIRPFVTVFPKDGKLLVNLDTAPQAVLMAFARNYSGQKTNTTLEDADALVEKIMDFRDGADARPATKDDRSVDLRYLALNAKERVICLLMFQHRTLVSDYLRIRSTGTDKSAKVSTTIEAVVDRATMAIVDWRRM